MNGEPRCWLPWRMFRVMSDGEVNLCCANRRPIGNVLRDGFDAVWNSAEAQDMRSRIAAGDYEGAGCGGCFFWGSHEAEVSHWPAPEFELDATQAENRSLQEAEYRAGAPVLASRPTIFFAQPGYTCNIRCIMCNQGDGRIDGLVVDPDRLVDVVLTQPVLPEMVILQGGEPMIVRQVLRALQVIADRGGACRVNLNTNGLVAHRHLALLDRLPRLRLNISIDAGDAETYERIRVGGDWKRLQKNIALLHARRQPDWRLNAHHVPMRGNLSQVDTILLAHAHWADQQRVFPVQGSENSDENPFCYFFLLDDVPGWEDALQRALAWAEGRGDGELAQEVRYVQALLRAPFRLDRPTWERLLARLGEPEARKAAADVSGWRSDHVSGRTPSWSPVERWPELAST